MTAAATYDAASEVLVFRLERQADNPRVLVLPTRPISTTARSITLVNDVLMELGCRSWMPSRGYRVVPIRDYLL